MSKILSYIIPGMVVAALIMTANATIIPQNIQKADWYITLTSILYLACIVIPCIIAFIRLPPGKDTRPN